MGTSNLPTATDGTVIPAADHNALKSALTVDLVPRNSSGVPTVNAGNLGSGTYPWKGARITTGYHALGDLKMHHSFGGSVKAGQGWFPCTGGVINKANYDAYHGAGSWDVYIIASVLSGKYAPDYSAKYPVGVSTTTQDGSIAITPVGNIGNAVNLAHTHTGPSHNHQWYKGVPGGPGTTDQTYNSGGTAANLSNATSHSSFGAGLVATAAGAGSLSTLGDGYTSNAGNGNTGSGGSASQSIQPESIETEYFVRIVE